MEEIWKDIPGFEGYYQASNFGRIKSLGTITKYKPKERILKLAKSNAGYLRVHIGHHYNRRTWNVHRLIAITFIPNPLNKKEVNHIDGDTTNNKVDNLEWVTPSENIKHSFERLGKRPHNCKKVKCIETGKIYDCVMDASRDVGVRYTCITACCRHDRGRHTSGGYHWEWVE